MKERELDSALQDLQLLTRENQAITAEIAGIANARNELMRELEEQRVRAARLDHALRTYEIEKKDLMTSIRGLAEEKRQVDRELEEAMYAKQRLNQTIQQLQVQSWHLCFANPVATCTEHSFFCFVLGFPDWLTIMADAAATRECTFPGKRGD